MKRDSMNGKKAASPLKFSQPTPRSPRSPIVNASPVLTPPKSGPKWTRCDLLGEGGFAKVYTVQHIESGVYYAGKFSNLKKGAQQELVEEIKVHKKLDHPNILKYISSFKSSLCEGMGYQESIIREIENGKCSVLIVELCPNKSLYEMLKLRKRITEEETKFYMYQLAEALEYLRKNKLIHRDIKPGNCLIDGNMNLKLADFGMAENISEKPVRTIRGTPNYVAPETLRGGISSYPSDVWALGCCIYALIVEKPPFETDNVKETYNRIKFALYGFPSEIKMSDNVRDLIDRILIRNPDKRITISKVLEHPFFNNRPESIPASARSIKPDITPSDKNTLFGIKNLWSEYMTEYPAMERDERKQYRRPFFNYIWTKFTDEAKILKIPANWKKFNELLDEAHL